MRFKHGFGVSVLSLLAVTMLLDLMPRAHGSAASAFSESDGRLGAGQPGGDSLVYGTFLGGSGEDRSVGDVALGPDGSIYVVGFTESTDFPTTSGAFDRTLGGDEDAFVAKLDPTGSTLIYGTYLGGTGPENIEQIVIGPDGSAYVGGDTGSEDFPTTPGAFDSTFGTGEAFVARIDPSGSSLIYSTFLGGDESNEEVEGLALGPDGTVVCTGETNSHDFPTTPGSFDPTYNEGTEAFVTALNATGTDLVYSTFLGGMFGDHGHAIALGPNREAYVLVEPHSSDFPTTPGAFDETYNGGSGDVSVTKLTPDGSALVYSTFVGGTEDDEGKAIAVDGSGNAYVTGITDSEDYPTTQGAYDSTFNPPLWDIMATKINPTGTDLVYSTFLGGKRSDLAQDLLVEPDGSILVGAWTSSTNFPTTSQAFDRRLGGSADAVVARFDPMGSQLLYSSFVGGTALAADEAYAIVSPSPGLAMVAGWTGAGDFPTTAGAYDRTFNGDVDAFVATLRVAQSLHVASIDPGYQSQGPGYVVGARILILSTNGSPVPGAAVRVGVTYPDGETVLVEATTEPDGGALVRRRTFDTGTYAFTVLGVTKSPAVYDPGQNIESSDSIVIR